MENEGKEKAYKQHLESKIPGSIQTYQVMQKAF